MNELVGELRARSVAGTSTNRLSVIRRVWAQLLARRVMPGLVAGLAGLKLVLGAVAIRTLRRKRLVADRTLLVLGGVWLATFAVLFGTLAWLVPAEVAPAYTLAPGVLLPLPLARLSAMPLALDWNRHR